MRLSLQPFAITVAGKFGYQILRIAMQDIPNGVMPGNILYLSSAEIVLCGQDTRLRLVQFGYHFSPHAHTGFHGWPLKLDLVEESALKRFIHILSEVGCGNENSIQCFHFLKDDVLD